MVSQWWPSPSRVAGSLVTCGACGATSRSRESALRGSRRAEHVDLRRVALPGRQANEEPVELARPEAGSCSEAGGDTRPPRVLGPGARVEDVDVAFAADDVHPIAAGVVEQVVRVADARDGRDLLVRHRVENQEERRLYHTEQQQMPTISERTRIIVLDTHEGEDRDERTRS